MKNNKFTLIELLVTIAIIAILAAMLFPAISHIRNQARVTQARAEMQSIETAIKSYESTYGILPENDSYTNLMRTLTNVNAPSGRNSRGIRFLDVQNGSTEVWVDPWGNQYNIFIDSDYDDRVTVNSQTFIGTVFITSNGNGTQINSWQ